MTAHGGGVPAYSGDLAGLYVYVEIGGGVGGRGDGGRPSQPVRDGGVGVVQPEVILGTWTRGGGGKIME